MVVDALGRGEQILVLRKGGINEGRGGFKIEHAEFLLFPTLFHEQRQSVVPTAQKRFDEITARLPGPSTVPLEFLARVVEWRELESLEMARRLRGQHLWRDKVIAQRFDWGRAKGIFALALRVFRLGKKVELPMRESYGGCKSWIELEREMDVTGSESVLDDATFASRLERFKGALEPAGVATS